jgi:hypothetical protein
VGKRDGQDMRSFFIRWGAVGFVVSVFITFLPYVLGPRVYIVLYPSLFVLSPSLYLIYEVFPLHGAPIFIVIVVWLILAIINMLLYGTAGAIYWKLMRSSRT